MTIPSRSGYLQTIGCGISLLILLLNCRAEEANPIQPELISEYPAIQPGVPFRVGVAIDHPEGYHSYWQHPGLVGVPWQLEWQLPAGFEAGEILWPLPKRVKMFDIDANGYHGRQLLMVEITPPEDLPAETSITLAARAVWMCCSETCHPGNKQLQISLPVASASGSAPQGERDARFVAADKALPSPIEGWTVTGRLTGKGLRINITPDSPVISRDLGDIYFFCAQGIPNSDLPQELKQRKKGYTLKTERWEFAPEAPTRLIGLLHAENGWQDGRHHLPVDIPLEIKGAGKRNEKEASQTP